MVRSIDYLRQNCSVPLERQGAGIVIVIDDPLDLGRTDALRRIYSDRGTVTFWVGLRDEIMSCIDRSAGAKGDVGDLLRGISDDAAAAGAEIENADDANEGLGAESDSKIIKLVDQIIIDAFNKRASDIHVEPYGKEGEVEVRFRVDGDLLKYQNLPPTVRNAVCARIKIMAGLDIAERRK